MPLSRPQDDEFDQVEDYIDYGAIAENEWDTMQTQAQASFPLPTNTITPSASTYTATSSIPASISWLLNHSSDSDAEMPNSTVPGNGNGNDDMGEEGGSRTRTRAPLSRSLENSHSPPGSSSSSYGDPLETYSRRQMGGEDLEARDETTPEAGPSTLPPVPFNLRRASSTSYFGDDSSDLDESFFEQLDAVERGIVEQETTTGYNSPTRTQNTTHISRDRTGQHSPAHPLLNPDLLESDISNSMSYTLNTPRGISKRRRSSAERDGFSPKKKGKSKMETDDSLIKSILADYEDEVNCPVCCDFIVGAHVFNPCGHSLCGDCGFEWAVKNRKSTCPVCRTKCDLYKPMLPNILVDNIIQKYVVNLAFVDPAWAPGGTKWVEWNTRQQNWKRVAAMRTKAMTYHRPVAKHSQGEYDMDPDIIDGVAGRLHTRSRWETRFSISFGT
ncbi:ring finger protein 8 [Moniliophthora roreri MCA 2997]|uniref:Ring finger protein 8 n=1 Tax=Moniliophthora roreri (strain MCA 2997) TaxID=1381753 RepID=V2XXJ7_MONRO|nr:ring finger protein 8 [Moniliophthora roreri MCA 2997]